VDNPLIDMIWSNYITFHEIMYSYEAKNVEKLKQFVQIAVSNASYLRFVQN
jgi:hypothetical protein